MAEVLIEDFGYDELKKHVVASRCEGIKIAGYVGCQTNRPFGRGRRIVREPDVSRQAGRDDGWRSGQQYDQKVTCCGGALAFSEPEKSQKQIKDIIESAYDHGAEMIVTPCPLCQANVEIYQGQINKRYRHQVQHPGDVLLPADGRRLRR